MRYWELNDVAILWRELVIHILRCNCFYDAGGIQKNASFDNVNISTFFGRKKNKTLGWELVKKP